MKPEIKTAAIFGIVIVGIIASLSIVFSSLETSNLISETLDEKKIPISDVGRNQLGNTEGFNPENDVSYTIPDDLKLHHFYIDWIWKNLQGSMKLVSDEARIQLPYFAKEVNIVTAGKAELTILLDGNPISFEYGGRDVSSGKIQVEEPGLYNIVTSKEAESHTLEIQVLKSGFEMYTFTFG